MKILQLTCHFRPNIGGVETHLNDLVEGLVKKENIVFILTYRPLNSRASWKVYEKGKHYSVLRIPWLAGLFYKLVKNPTLEFLYLLPGLFLVTPVVILCFRPQVIHTHGLIAGFTGVFWGKLFGKRVITTTHSIYSFPNNGVYRNFAKWIFSNSGHVLTLSKQSKNEIEKLGIGSNKISVFTYWIDMDKFKPVENAKKKLGWRDKFTILFVGRLVEEKGILILLEAAAKWNKNITLRIIGTGPLEHVVRKYQMKYSNIFFLGKVDNDKLPIYYSGADLLVVPSVSEEGFGRVILESLACGTPVIGSNRGAIPEALDESVGVLVDVNPENIGSIIERNYINPEKLTLLSKNTVKYAENKYSNENIMTIINSYRL